MATLLRVDKDKCEKDGICVEVCPIGILAVDTEKWPVVRAGMGSFCIACGHCVAACPHGALDNARNRLHNQTPVRNLPVVAADTALTFLRSRRSIRCYKPDPVPRELTIQLLQAARYAPSGHNSQGISYLIVDNRESLDAMCAIILEWMAEVVRTRGELANRLHFPGIIKAHERGEDRILRKAPQLIVATAQKELKAAQVTTYLALEYVELYATSLGLGTCWAGFAQICAQQYSQLQEFLLIPEMRLITGHDDGWIPKKYLLPLA
jgi:nitroreductase/NAD-dependent dihydropyrimidine dehydrogenase PreA subunit